MSAITKLTDTQISNIVSALDDILDNSQGLSITLTIYDVKGERYTFRRDAEPQKVKEANDRK